VKECDEIIAAYEQQFGQTQALADMKDGRKRRRDLESGKLSPDQSKTVREMIEREAPDLFNPRR